MQRTVIEDHSASYADPIVLNAGDPVALTGKQDVWDGHRWLWALGADGKAGWIPDSLVVSKHGRPCAGYDYSAVELTCAHGETLTVIEERHGWAWCRSANGDQGWVPLRNLSPPSS